MSIPKEKDGKNKTFGFVTFKHLITVPYALNIFSGTKLFGRELTLRNRNANNNSSRNSLSSSNQQSPLSSSFNNPLLSAINDDMFPQYNMLPLVQQPFAGLNQQYLQNQLMSLATMQAMQIYGNNSTQDTFPSTRTDSHGSQRDFVDRNRYHRDDERNNRSKPYRRSRSRSPQNRKARDRSRSPVSRINQYRDNDRHQRSGGYQRWNHRK